MSLYGAVAGALPGKKIVTGSFTPTSGQTIVLLGHEFTGIDAAVAQLEALDLTHLWTFVTITGASLVFNHRKPTAVDDVTPIPATTPWNVVRWIAVGDAPR